MCSPLTVTVKSRSIIEELRTLPLRIGLQINEDNQSGISSVPTGQSSPPVWIINFEGDKSLKWLKRVKSEFTECYFIVLCPADKIRPLQNQLLNIADDILGRPIQLPEIEAALARAARWQGLQMRLGAFEEIRADRLTPELIETERLLGVRQIVDKMSQFIAQVAGDVHGGVKYFNELPYFVSIHSPDCKILAANPTYLRYLGNQIYKDSWEIYVGKRASRMTCPVGRTARTGDTLKTRSVARYLSGARVPVIVHTAPIFDNDGEIVLILEIFAGTKEIDLLAEEVRTTQQRYQQLFDAVPSNIAVLDRRLRINDHNRRFVDNFGHHVGTPFFDVLRPAGFPAFRDPISKTVKNGEPNQGEMVLTDRRSQPYNVMAWTAPIKTRPGKLIQVLVVFTDITELRQLQDNLSSLGLMIGTISHDLKGYLTGLDAGLYLIDTGFYRNKPGRIEEGLDVSRMMVDRFRKMVQDILYYTKERELELEEVSVEAFAYDVVANVDHRIRAADIQFDIKIKKEIGSFTIDTGLLRTALINIFDNAIEACIEDDRDLENRIVFEVTRIDNGIQMVIADSGPGIPESQINQIFEMFYSSKGKKGTGLGLFITRKAIEKHGGEISAEATTGKGARFAIRLPR